MLRDFKLTSKMTALLLFWATVVWVAPAVDAGPKKPAANDYSIAIAGYVNGTGKATFDGSLLSMTCTVTDENGTKGTFSATGLKVDGRNHFVGSGTAMGEKITLGGRLDPVAGKETTLKTDRVVCTFSRVSKDGHGRVAGFVPVNAALSPPKKD